MLATLGLRWSDLHGAFGDKKLTDASGRETKKSNGIMGAHLARLQGHHGGMISPPLQGAKRQRGVGRLGREGALWPSIRWLNAVMMRHQLWVDPRCVRVIAAFDTWDGTERHATKDALDGLRYALVRHWAQARQRRAAPVEVRAW
jgi:hypothetical protein